MTVASCAEIVRRGDPDRFAATMAAPVSAREILFPIYAFNVEVARAPWVTAEPMIAEMRLQWWRDALDEIAAGGPVRRHEVVVPLAVSVDAEGAKILESVVAARRADIEAVPFTDIDALWTYIDATAGGLMWTAARALGGDEEAAVRPIGRAAGVAAYLTAIPELRARGKRPLPDESEATIRSLADRALDEWDGSFRAISRRARPALFPAWTARGILRRAAQDPSLVMQGALEPSEFKKRAGLLSLALSP